MTNSTNSYEPEIIIKPSPYDKIQMVNKIGRVDIHLVTATSPLIEPLLRMGKYFSFLACLYSGCTLSIYLGYISLTYRNLIPGVSFFKRYTKHL